MISKALCYTSVGVFCAIILLFAVSSFIRKNIKLKTLAILMILLAVSATIISYFLVATTEQDLTRYYAMLDELAGQNFSYAFTTFKYKTTPLTALWFFVVAKIGNYQLLQTLPTLIVFLCVAYIATDVYKTHKPNFQNYAISFLSCLACVEMVIVFTTVRYYCAASLLVVAIYRFLYKNKIDAFTFILPALAMLIHYGCAIILIVALLCCYNLKNFNIFFIFSFFILIVLSKALMLIDLPLIAGFGL